MARRADIGKVSVVRHREIASIAIF
jgi:hypothetical protein